MLALSSYSAKEHILIAAALQNLADPSKGFTANSWFYERGVFARFVWPDWPDTVRNELAVMTSEFHRQYTQLLEVPEGSSDWKAVFRDWRADSESASVIGEAFSNHFPARVAWVESERDRRGRIGASCMVRDLLQVDVVRDASPISSIIRDSMTRRAERVPCSLQRSWKDSMAIPPGPLSETDREAFQSSVQQVFRWAKHRIRTILDALHDRLKTLYGERFRGLYVFGSYARSDAGIELPEDSDLDVALILSDFENSYDEIRRTSDITLDLGLEHSLVISLVPVREEDFKEGRTNFTRVISEYAIRV